MERHQRIQLKTTSRSTNQPFKVSPFQTRGFGVQQKAASTPASKAELWENYQRSSQITQQGAGGTRSAIQTKLSIGQSGDKYEQEADSVADRVMAMSEPAQVQREELGEEEEELQMKPLAGMISPLVQREELPEEEEELQMKPEDYLVQREELPEEEEELQMKSLDNSIQREELPEEEEEIQMKEAATSNTPVATTSLEDRLSSSKGGGSPLSDDVRSFMEPRFGSDFSGVRVHTGSDAVQMNQDVSAQAFAHGQDVYFGAGKAPGKDALTAHELTHVVQQTGASAINTQEIQAYHDRQNIKYISQAAIQRDDQTVKSNHPQEGLLSLLEKNRPSVEAARANALVRIGKITKLQIDGNRAVGSIKGKLLSTADRYDTAYGTFSKVISAARQEARDQQEYVDIVVGIVTGVAVALCFEAVGAVALVEKLGEGVAGLLAKTAIKAGGEAVGEMAEAVVGKAIDKSGITEVAGKDLQPDGLKPEVLRMNIWQYLCKLNESVAKTSTGSLDQSLLMSSAEYAIGEIKSQRGGGSDMDINMNIELVSSVINTDKSSKALDSALDNASAKIEALETSTAKMPNYDVAQMEKDIWILWMSRLAKDCNIIDLDAIEDHLESLGLFDSGWYTTDDEENEAIENAKQQAAEIRGRLPQL
jgi:hypothetical protein